MIRAVLDTNIIVSALLTPAGPLAPILDLAALRRFRCYLSEGILDEYEDVLARAHLRLDQELVRKSVDRLRRSAIHVAPRKKLRACSDPADDKFPECALEARADYVVTGNVRHFPARFQDIRIIIPRQFLTALKVELR
jgi:putative PIN family toxin of toxin-antitoxin system